MSASTPSILAAFNSPGRPRSTTLHWAGKSFWAIANQGLFAGSNFLMNLCLARWLSPRDYGAFAAAFTVFLTLATLHTAFVAEPMLLFASHRYRQRQRDYLRAVMAGQGLVCLLVGAVLAAVAAGCWWRGYPALARAFGALGLAQPFILFMWLVRQASYLRGQMKEGAFAGAAHLALMLAGLLALWNWQALSVATALLVMALAGLLAGGLLAWRLNLPRPGSVLWAEAAAEHWRYGRWIAATELTGMTPGILSFLLLPLFAGLQESGTLRALLNLLTPLNQTLTALSTLLLLQFVRLRGSGRLKSLVRVASFLLIGGTLLAWLLLGTLHRPLVHLVCGSAYVGRSRALWVLGALPVLAAVQVIAGNLLRAEERSVALFHAGLISSVLASAAGLGLMYWSCWWGAIVANALTSAIGAAVLLWSVRGAVARSSPAPVAAASAVLLAGETGVIG